MTDCSASGSSEQRWLTVGELLDRLGFILPDHVGIFAKRGDETHAAVRRAEKAPDYLARLAARDNTDVYFGPQPQQGPPHTGDRGTAATVAVVRCFYADLDVKPGACQDINAAQQIIDDIAGLIGERPVAVIHSGGGLQPIWRLEPVPPKQGAALLRRFGMLARQAAAARGARLDSVFDTARVLRAPGTFNYKYDPPRTVHAVADTGAPITPGTLAERFDEYSIPEAPSDNTLNGPIHPHSEWRWGATTCRYITAMVEAWRTDTPTARHPWLLSQIIRLEAAHRLGCVTHTDYDQMWRQLVERARWLCATQEPHRTLTDSEIAGIARHARGAVATKTADDCHRELGNHRHADVINITRRATIEAFFGQPEDNDDADDRADDVGRADDGRRADDNHRRGAQRGAAAASDGSSALNLTLAEFFRASPDAADADAASDGADAASAASSSSSSGAASDWIDPGARRRLARYHAQLVYLEGDFWETREEHRVIHRAALSRMASPWAVFGVVAARLLHTVPPWIVLPPLIGGPGSLNVLIALAARPGGGKGAAADAADDLVKPLQDEEHVVTPIGTGEGLTEGFRRSQRGKKDDDPPKPVRATLVEVDEIDSFSSLKQRGGSTTSALLRSAFSGKTLGFAYRGRADETVTAHTYRLNVVAAVQPTQAVTVLEEQGGGLPQRFLWLPAFDRRIDDQPPTWPLRDNEPAVIPVMRPGDYQNLTHGGTIEIPETARREILKTHAAANRGELPPLDGHALFIREKIAFVIALLDERCNITDEDWRLATIVTKVSNLTRNWVINEARHAANEQAETLGEQYGLRNAAAKAAEQFATTEAVLHTKNSVLDKLAAAGGELSSRDLSRGVTVRLRKYLLHALEVLVQEQRVERVDGPKGGTIWRLIPPTREQ